MIVGVSSLSRVYGEKFRLGIRNMFSSSFQVIFLADQSPFLQYQKGKNSNIQKNNL